MPLKSAGDGARIEGRTEVDGLKPSGLPPSKGGDNRTSLGLASFVSSNAAGTYGLHVRGEDDVSYLKSGSGDWEKVTAGQQRQLRDGDRIAVGGKHT